MLSWTRWAMWKHIIFAILGTLVVAGGLSACDPIAPDVVGQALPDAIQRLELRIQPTQGHRRQRSDDHPDTL